MTKVEKILQSLPTFANVGEGASEQPPLIPGNLKIYSGFSERYKNKEDNPFFCHGNYIMIMMISGLRSIIVNEKTIELNENDAIIIPPFAKHKTVAPGKNDFSSFMASFHFPPEESRLNSICGHKFVMRAAARKLFLASSEKFTSWYNGTPADAEDAVCLFAMMLRMLLNAQDSKPHTGIHRNINDIRLHKVVEYLNNNRDHKVSLQELSSALLISGSTIRQLFKKQMKRSLGNYELTRRLRLGIELLISSELTAAEIASRIGFESSGSFLRALRRECGKTSGEIRKMALHENLANPDIITQR